MGSDYNTSVNRATIDRHFRHRRLLLLTTSLLARVLLLLMSQSVPTSYAQACRQLSLEDEPIPEWAHVVLDLGCGDGRATLDAEDAAPPSVSDRLICGVDIDMGSLSVCKTRRPHLKCFRARGEHLPFRDETFDYVRSAVALPYMDLVPTLREVLRVLKPGGELWGSLHTQLFV